MKINTRREPGVYRGGGFGAYVGVFLRLGITHISDVRLQVWRLICHKIFKIAEETKIPKALICALSGDGLFEIFDRTNAAAQLTVP